MKTDFSDHYSIFTFSDLQITPVIAKAITRREFSERNKAEFIKQHYEIHHGTMYTP